MGRTAHSLSLLISVVLLAACGAPPGVGDGGVGGGGGGVGGGTAGGSGGAAGGGAGGGGTGGGGAGGGGAAGGSGGGAGGGGGGIVNPMPCTAGGAVIAPAEIRGRGVEVGYTSGNFVAPGSNLAGSLTTGSNVRVELVPQSAGNPPHTELSLFVNGCGVGKLPDVGEEYWWTTRPGNLPVSVTDGKSLVIEAVRSGQGVVLRRVFAVPPILPRLISPAANAAITAPVALQWTPLTMPTGAKLSVTAWRSLGGGGGMTDGYLALPDPSLGQASWNAGKSTWTSLQLQSTVTYESGVTFYFSYYVPVN